LRIYKNRVLRRVFGPEVEGGGQKVGRSCRVMDIIIFTLYQILSGVVKLRRMRWVEHVALQKSRYAWRN